MKKLWIAMLGMLMATTAMAQEEGSDTTKVKMGSFEVNFRSGVDIDDDEKEEPKDTIIDPKNFVHWAGIDVGTTMLLNADGGTSLPEGDRWLDLDEARSLTWSINFAEARLPIYKNYVGIGTGLGITYRSLGLNDNVTVLSNSDSTYAVDVPDSLYTFDRNKLRATYIRVPVLFDFNTDTIPSKNRFHISVGAIAGVRIGSITKQIYDFEGQKYTDRVKDDFNLSPLTLDATARVGYRGVNLWATYSLTPLFENGKGPEVYPITVGLSFSIFDDGDPNDLDEVLRRRGLTD